MPTDTQPQPPTKVRYLVLTVTSLVAVFMYVDRVCIAHVTGDIQRDLNLTPAQMDWVLSAFFWSYALAQVPAGVLGVRYGFRQVLSIYLFSWSFFTAVSGVAGGFAALIGARLAVGVTEAGSYPTAAALVKGWFPLERRGFASSVVSLGGRMGNAFGQLLTPIIVATLTGLTIAGVTLGPGWRTTLVLFGVAGMVWSLVFWYVVRDRPSLHPWSNAAESDLVGPMPAASVSPTARPKLVLYLTSRNMWALSLLQFCTNLGWAFLITQYPGYLETVFHKTGEEKGLYAAIPAFIGAIGMFAGGLLTDAMVRRLGLRLGRILPIVIGASMGGLAYVGCSFAGTAEEIVAAMCLMAIGTDLAVPAVWAVAQDIGGQQVGPVLGWGNMWGNIGAAVCPLLLGVMERDFGWHAVFLTAASGYVIVILCALMLNAARPLEPENEL